MTEELLREAVHWITRIVEIIGILIILVGAVVALGRFGLNLDRDKGGRIACLRSNLAARFCSGSNSWSRLTSSTRWRSSRRWTASSCWPGSC